MTLSVGTITLYNIDDRWMNEYGTVHPRTDHEGPEEGVEVYLYSFLNLGARWGGWSTSRPGRFTPG
jgi:hypothetical protein